MKRSVCILICENLRREVETALSKLQAPDLRCHVVAFDAACHKAPGSSERLPRLLAELQPAFPDGIHIIGSNCIAAMQRQLADTAGNVRFHRTDSCFALLCNAALVDDLVSRGAHLLSPGWLARSKQNLADWGFDQQTAREFFHDCTKELVLLDTGTVANAAEQLQTFAGYLDLPARRVPVGTDVLALHLREMLHGGADAEQGGNDRTGAAARQVADYAMAFDLIGRLDRLQEETQTARAILEILQILFAPASAVYYPIEPTRRMGPVALPEGCEHRAGNLADAILQPDGGIAFSLDHEGKRLAVVVASEVALPEQLSNYRNLAFQLSPVFAMAVANVRAIERIRKQESILADELVLAGAAQRELLQPGMENEAISVRPVYAPYRWISGDAYGYLWFPGNKILRGYILDVTGHSVATALQTTATSVILQRALTDAGSWDSRLLHELNGQLMHYFTETTFAALLLFEFDLSKARLLITGGGIHDFYVGAPQPGWQRLGSSLTGILPEPEFGELSLPLSKGDYFCFMTDGFYELLTKKDRLFAPASAVAAVDLLQQCAKSPDRWDDGAALCIEIL